MADTVGQADIRGLDIIKTVKGFALQEFIFKADVTVASSTGDAIRWYQETATDLTATAPGRVANSAFGAAFLNLEPSWTRNTTYTRQYSAESFVPMMDILTADIPVLARVLLRLTRAVVKQVDSRIWDVLTNSRAGVTAAATDLNLVTTSGAWTSAAADPIRDILRAKQFIFTSGNYNPEGGVLYLSPTDHTNLLSYLIFAKGSNVPAFASEKLRTGTVMNFLGLEVRLSDVITADYALVGKPDVACTWYSTKDTTVATEEKAGYGTKFVVYEIGEGVLTDPKAMCLISDTQ